MGGVDVVERDMLIVIVSDRRKIACCTSTERFEACTFENAELFNLLVVRTFPRMVSDLDCLRDSHQYALLGWCAFRQEDHDDDFSLCCFATLGFVLISSFPMIQCWPSNRFKRLQFFENHHLIQIKQPP